MFQAAWQLKSEGLIETMRCSYPAARIASALEAASVSADSVGVGPRKVSAEARPNVNLNVGIIPPLSEQLFRQAMHSRVRDKPLKRNGAAGED